MEAARMVFPVRYVSEGSAIQTTSRGLSGEGVAVRSLLPPRLGARVSLALYLPGNPKPEVAVGVVAASARDRPVPAGFWVQFTAIQTTSRGLSGEGVAVRSLLPPRIGARVSLALYLPGNPKPEVAVGVVAASARDRPVPAGFWVQFTAIDSGARERISALVAEKARQARELRAPRGFQRFHTQFTVRFRTAREFVREHTQNISRGGVFIQTSSPPQIDEVITVQLELPDGGEAATTSGLVMHRVMPEEAEQQGTVPGIGVQFLDADDQFRERIDRYVQRLGSASA